jgi:Ser/Thr protein kinase RdoA (MazF antagonist)
MKSFGQLTRRGQIRRLRELALHALGQYSLEVTELRLVGVYTNTLFRLRTGDDRLYVLRVCTPGWRAATDLRSEAMWLQALHRDTDIGAPVPVPARNGSLIIEASAAGVPGPRLCGIASWIPGPLLGSRLTEDNLFEMGVLFARLHEHGASFSPPKGFTKRKMDNIYARSEQDVLFSGACRDAFTPRTRELLDQSMVLVREAFEYLYADRAGLQVIHNDLHHDNIKLDRGRLRPFDFEDTIWGYPVQDIAMALQDLMMAVAPDAFDPLQAAFRHGYESRNRWPERYAGQIDTFRAGRLFWVANYVARYEPPYLKEHVDWTARILEGLLETGRIRKPRSAST